jgi:hypothetical protein
MAEGGGERESAARLEESQAAMIGNKSPEKAMADAARRVAPLVRM